MQYQVTLSADTNYDDFVLEILKIEGADVLETPYLPGDKISTNVSLPQNEFSEETLKIIMKMNGVEAVEAV